MLTRITDPGLYRLADKTQSITTSSTSSEMADGVGSAIDVVMINATEDALQVNSAGTVYVTEMTR